MIIKKIAFNLFAFHLWKGLYKAMTLSVARVIIMRMEQERDTSFRGYISWGLRNMQVCIIMSGIKISTNKYLKAKFSISGVNATSC